MPDGYSLSSFRARARIAGVPCAAAPMMICRTSVFSLGSFRLKSASPCSANVRSMLDFAAKNPAMVCMLMTVSAPVSLERGTI
jgi:hypothetical protein